MMDDNLRQRNTSKGNLKDLLSPENGNHSNSDSRQSRSSSNSSTSSKKSRSSSNSSNSSSKMKPTLNKKTKKRPQQLFKLFLLAIALSTLPIIYGLYTFHKRAQVATPLNAPRIIHEGSSSPYASPERYWGTYRSGVYFGLKTRRPNSPVTGLMWFKQHVRQRPLPIRHTCEQSDQLESYGWLKHDGLNFGIQDIVEKEFSLTTQFVKRPGGRNGGDWSARINGKKKGNRPVTLSLLFYIALDGDGEIEPIIKQNFLDGVKGYTKALGHFTLKFPTVKNATSNHFLVSYAPSLAQLKDVVLQRLRVFPVNKTVNMFGLAGVDSPTISKAPDQKPNFIVKQITVKFPFQMEVLFESGTVSKKEPQLMGREFYKVLKQYTKEFDATFESLFSLEEKGFRPNETVVAKAALSNMLGGVGYFYGNSLVQSIYNKEPVPYWEAALMTAVPSRSFFPRGFLWDEGFHNLLISRWDPQLSMEIIGHWLDLMNVEGWIPREQILGSEALMKVPREFVVQFNTNANPPTLFLPLQHLMEQESFRSDPRFQKYMHAIFPRLKAWYQWFNNSQTGPEPGTYRWRGRNHQTSVELNPKTLTSGLDDFPRASHPSKDEKHVDLRCWMTLASKVIADIADMLGEESSDYKATYRMLADNQLLDKQHWSSIGHMYSDFGNHAPRVALERAPSPPAPKPRPGQRLQRPPLQPLLRVVKTKGGPTMRFVDAFGYVSLFPFLLQILEPSSPKLGQILTDLRDPKLLWTEYGLRSLSKSDPVYMKYNTEHDPPYWRGAIWINMNYLAVRALHHYSKLEGPHQTTAGELYAELRTNIIRTIVTQYHKNGYIWENYNDKNGKGQGSHPFTGWSALLVLLMSESF
ncbi:mannosyl-oligosaccharide glucosidase-like isoform X2 [Apostichopus japonicus]|uniref:mannosyl-oligosaccharide glucosidase-like isoform X2 n=1 Tax=Stichopus japonicus TaxID=307972 RepID=UPI003AB63AC3